MDQTLPIRLIQTPTRAAEHVGDPRLHTPDWFKVKDEEEAARVAAAERQRVEFEAAARQRIDDHNWHGNVGAPQP